MFDINYAFFIYSITQKPAADNIFSNMKDKKARRDLLTLIPHNHL